MIATTISAYCAVGENYCIIPSLDDPCPQNCSNEEHCSTLQHSFIQTFSLNASASAPRNITFELMAGEHSLSFAESGFQVSNKDLIKIMSEKATITCSNHSADSGFIFFMNIHTVYIKGIKFVDCQNIIFADMHGELSIQNSIIMNHYQWAASSVNSVSIIKTTFINGYTLQVSASLLVVKQSTFINSTSEPSVQCNGGAINFSGSHSSFFVIEQTTFMNNTASGSKCSGHDIYMRGRGGAVYSSSTRLRISSSRFVGNTATHSGGAVSVGDGFRFGGKSSIEVHNSSFDFNSGGRYAGALYYTYNGDVFINISRFSHNIAGKKGGALYISTSHYFDISILLSETLFSYNRVSEPGGEGGVAYVNDDSSHSRSSASFITIFKSNFTHNIASGNAGVLQTNFTKININESSFDGNRAGRNGGVIDINTNSHTALSLNQSLFSNNRANEDGGVMCIKICKKPAWWEIKSLITIDHESRFVFNTAFESGGVIALLGGWLAVYSTEICCSNRANLGGVIKACNSNITIVQRELFKRSDPTDIQCTLFDSLYAITSNLSTTTNAPLPTPVQTTCKNIHHQNSVLMGFSITLAVLVLMMFTTLICISLYLFNNKVQMRSKVLRDNRSLFVPMNENEST